MEGVMIPFLPTSLWILATSVGIIIVILAILIYWHYRLRLKAALGEFGGIAKLAQTKLELEAAVQSKKDWLINNEAELVRVAGERIEQEKIKVELEGLERRIADNIETEKKLIFDVTEKQGKLSILEIEINHLNQDKQNIVANIQKINDEYTKSKLNLDGLTKSLIEVEGKIKDQEKKLSGLDQQLQQIKNNLSDSRISVKEQEDIRTNLVKTIDSLKAQHQELEGKINAANKNLSAVIKSLDKDKEALQIKRTELLSVNNELSASGIKCQDLLTKVNDLEKEFKYWQDTIKNLKAQSDPLKMENDRAKKELDDTKRDLSAANALRQDIGSLENLKTALESKVSELEKGSNSWEVKIKNLKAQEEPLKKEIEKAKKQLEDTKRDLSAANALRQDIGNLERRKTALELECKILDKKLTPVGQQQVQDAYADLLKSPECLSSNEFKQKNDEEDEITALSRLKESLRGKGLNFSDRVVDAFHTSLKCHDINPLTVLAGVSGTGKTLLPMRYAEIMGMHRLVMAVQPRWDSPQDLFGFYNYLEKRYNATDLSRALVRYDPYNYENLVNKDETLPDRLFLVLLDEMNLARTEYYFSEFLSKLELRRLVTDESKKSQRSPAELGLGYGPDGHLYSIWVAKNVFFVGTMNEDESTQSLSDKVLDRANVLRFGKPSNKFSDAKYNSNLGSNQGSYLSWSTWKKWLRTPADLNSQNYFLEIRKMIDSLNDHMNVLGRPFGYRVAQAIEMYVANYPNRNKDRANLAFADQIEQKIIPKLRGLDVNIGDNSATLNYIGSIIRGLGDKELSKAFSHAIEIAPAYGLFQWSGVSRSDKDPN